MSVKHFEAGASTNMKKSVTVERTHMTCDGCGYLMNEKVEHIVLSIPEVKDFHFHAADPFKRTADADCFRCWAHNVKIMKDSLKNRNCSEGEIDKFLSGMLYRERPGGSDVAKPEIAKKGEGLR